jgi:hypothetical protein
MAMVFWVFIELSIASISDWTFIIDALSHFIMVSIAAAE